MLRNRGRAFSADVSHKFVSAHVKHIRLSQIFLFGLSIALIVSVWGSDDDTANALGEARALLGNLNKYWREGDFLRDYIDTYMTEHAQSSGSPWTTTSIDGQEYRFNLSLSPIWTGLPDEYLSPSQYVAVPVSESCGAMLCDALPTLCDKDGAGFDVEDSYGAQTRVALPETIGGYVGLHNAMTDPIRISMVAEQQLISARGVAAGLYRDVGTALVVPRSPKSIEIRNTEDGGDSSGSVDLELCFVRKSMTSFFRDFDVHSDVVQSRNPIAVGVADGGNGDYLKGVLVVLAVAPESGFIEARPNHLVPTGHHALTGDKAHEFRDDYPAVAGFLTRYRSRETLSISSLVQLLEELNKVEGGSLPLLNLSLPINLVPWLGLPLLLTVQLYIFGARRNLFRRGWRFDDEWWQAEAWVHTFARGHILGRTPEWIATGAMVLIVVGLWNPFGGGIRIDLDALPFAIPFVLGVVVVSIVVGVKDGRLGVDSKGWSPGTHFRLETCGSEQPERRRL